jgi:hypothetical protein
MSTTTTITLNNGTSNIDFVRASKSGNVVRFFKAGNTPRGDHTLQMNLKQPNGQRTTTVTDALLRQPLEYQDSTTGVYHVDDVALAKVQVVVPESMASADRTVLYNYLKNLVAHAVFSEHVVDREPLF